MTDLLEEIFDSDRDPLATVRSRIATWSATFPSPEKEIKMFTEFVAKNMKAKTWAHAPRKAFLIFSIASEDTCKATAPARVKKGAWESYFTFLVKVISKGSPSVGDSSANVEEADVTDSLQVRTHNSLSTRDRHF